MKSYHTNYFVKIKKQLKRRRMEKNILEKLYFKYKQEIHIIGLFLIIGLFIHSIFYTNTLYNGDSSGRLEKFVEYNNIP